MALFWNGRTALARRVGECFGGWRDDNHHRSPVRRRTLLGVEELETRQALAVLLPGTTHPLFLPQQPAAVAAPNPTLTGSPVNGKTTAPFLLPNGQFSLNSASATASLQASLPLTTSTNPAGNLIPLLTTNPLPPILQGATVVPPTGPLTFADAQVILTNFLGGGHSEINLNGNRAQSSLPARSPSPAPTPKAPPPYPGTELTANHPLKEWQPKVVSFQEKSPWISNPTTESLHTFDNAEQGETLAATPVLVAALAALWGKRHR